MVGFPGFSEIGDTRPLLSTAPRFLFSQDEASAQSGQGMDRLLRPVRAESHDEANDVPGYHQMRRPIQVVRRKLWLYTYQ
jgi:hypothetical protein